MPNKLYFIGPCGRGRVPTNGASAKNYQIVNFLKRRGIEFTIIDTEKWKISPLVFFRLFFCLFSYHGRYIISANDTSSYRLLTVLTKLPFRAFVAYWVIGGSLADGIKRGRFSSKPYKKIDMIMCEGTKMKFDFFECGIEKVDVVPNFKLIDFIPEKQFSKNRGIRFVFLSRMIPEKGVGVIIDAVKKLNKKGLKFKVDFYGPFENSYKDIFEMAIKDIDNITYKGFLNLNDTSNYFVLAEYDVMLFPTFWPGEGFPGVFIDAFVAGLPVIASDWNMNGELIKEGVNGWLIPPRNADALANVMEQIMENKVELTGMTNTCQKSARLYDINNVLNDKLLSKLGLLC